MPSDRKTTGEQRRQQILLTLRDSISPITGSTLAERMNVSRQVIVSDINLLKAKEEPILATSQGYLYMPSTPSVRVTKKIVCKHTPAQAETELLIIVNNGATVKNVSIEHPLYGDLTASLMLHSPNEVKRFMEQVKETEAGLLSELTEGIHLHEIEADHASIIEKVEKELLEAGILIDE
ncbi:transcription repressor NadR [Jeotgalibacillus aurantiacus]|uniref:transcription repressor NadR n=1 Tax=Jeotgalibacillus aurantiacus TaxID=2763266 RepID=UPI001D09EB5D|nr:transcription repressor NadR [Jeotgalibacillus aurantiacus]